MRINLSQAVQASLFDINELDRNYALIRPRDPDRALYKLIHEYHPEGVFVLRKDRKIISAAYCFGFPTGSGCIGGFFVDQKHGNASSILTIVRRCLLHLRNVGCAHAFSIVREYNIEDLGALETAGFTALYRRRAGIIRKKAIQALRENTKGVVCDRSEAKDIIKRSAIMYANTPQKGTVTFCFWPHKLSATSLDHILKSDNVFAVKSGKDSNSLALVQVASALSEGGRWFILPPNFVVHPSKGPKRVGEVLLAVGPDTLHVVTAATCLLGSCGVDRAYMYDYEPNGNSASYAELGFSFERPQTILSKRISSDEIKSQGSRVSAVLPTLDQYQQSADIV